MLWLQIVVRGFWHPTVHLGDYYLAHGQAERAIALHVHALATARYLRANAGRDADLAALRDTGQLDSVLTPVR